MFFSDLLRPESVIVPLNASDRDSAISALVDVLDLSSDPKTRAEFKAAILARETAGSTGLGNAAAVPHARTAAIASPRLAVGRTGKPVEFNAADGKPVTLFFLLAVPAADPGGHLRTLAALSRLVSDKKTLRLLVKASSPKELYDLISQISI